jgi:protein-S-isoprenylcysteine O-methyltransferase Ste14
MKKSGVRVAFGYALAVVVLACARPTSRSLLLALPLAALGEALRIWASGHIQKTRALATGGPYAHTRHPLYLGSALLALAAGIASLSPIAIGALCAYFVAFYPTVVAEEQAFLRAKFPSEFGQWERDVPLFLPRPLPAGPRSSRFSWRLVGANREWRTALALPALFGVLWARSRYFPDFP